MYVEAALFYFDGMAFQFTQADKLIINIKSKMRIFCNMKA